MTKTKALRATVILFAVVLFAVIVAPVFAQGTGGVGQGSRHGSKSKPGSVSRHVGVRHRIYVRGAYAQRIDRYDPDPYFQRQIDNFGFSGRDPSRIGGEDPDLHPARR